MKATDESFDVFVEEDGEKVKLGTVSVSPLSTAKEMRLLDKTTNSRGDYQISQWYSQYFKDLVDKFEPSDELRERVDGLKGELSAAELQNSRHRLLKRVCREVLSRVPNIETALGKSGSE